MLNALSIDLIEISGGSYEAPAMQGDARDGRTLAREAYSLEFARDIGSVAHAVIVTGGIRRLAVVERVLDSGIAMAGIWTAPAIRPDMPNSGAMVEFRPWNCRQSPGRANACCARQHGGGQVPVAASRPRSQAEPWCFTARCVADRPNSDGDIDAQVSQMDDGIDQR